MANTIENPITPVRPKLARGLESEPYAQQCRIAIKMQREKDKKTAKASKTPERKIAGKVDPKKDPKKAARQVKHVEEKIAKRKNNPPKEKKAGDISVSEIARELKMDPRIARAKLRRHEDKILKLHTAGQGRWDFPLSAKEAIIAILK